MPQPAFLESGALGRRGALRESLASWPLRRRSRRSKQGTPISPPARRLPLVAEWVARALVVESPRPARRAPRVSHSATAFWAKKGSGRARFERAQGQGTDILLSHAAPNLGPMCPSQRNRPPRLRFVRKRAEVPLTLARLARWLARRKPLARIGDSDFGAVKPQTSLNMAT